MCMAQCIGKNHRPSWQSHMTMYNMIKCRPNEIECQIIVELVCASHLQKCLDYRPSVTSRLLTHADDRHVH